jgi:hypothetical protein
LKNSNHTQFALYNNEDLYLTFNRALTTRDGSNNHGQPYWQTSSATIQNINNITIGHYVHYVNHSSVSGLVFSNFTAEPWCSPLNGRYVGGCANGNYGVGNWNIYIK